MKLPEISSLTLEQRLKLLGGKDCWNTEDLGGLLPSLCVTDGPCGVRMPKQNDNGEWRDLPSVAYPASVVIANSWDRKAAYDVAASIADDCIEKGADILLAPGVNIKRIPTCGRNFEYYSEDPYLSGELAYEYIKGLQDKGIGTSLKHFCLNNTEYDRQFQSSEVDERTIREIYLPAFERACEAKPWTVMCSYNLVNGRRMAEHKKLYKTLRGELGFDGLIVSDWGAVHDPVRSAKAGCNLEMGYCDTSAAKLKAAYEKGELTDEEINANIEKLFELIQKNEEAKKTRKITRTQKERLAASQKAAESGIVLLKNEDGILPLKAGKICVGGYPALDAYAGGGSAKVVPCDKIPALPDCLKEEMPKAEIVYEAGTAGWNAFANFRSVVEKSAAADIAVVCVGTGEKVEGEGTDRENIRLSRWSEDLIREVARANKNTVVIVYAGSAIDMSSWIDEVKGVIFAGFGGERVHAAVAGVLSGRVNPSGKLSETFPYSLEDVPAYNMPCDSHVCRYLEGLDVGYRYFATENADCLFPFGYGLSYSEFEYKDMKVKKTGEYDYEVKVTVENISDKDGAEIVQLYVADEYATVYRPALELKGFDKKLIKAGKSATFEFKLDKRSFAYYSAAEDAWVVDDGKEDGWAVNKNRYKIMAAASVNDVRLTEIIEL